MTEIGWTGRFKGRTVWKLGGGGIDWVVKLIVIKH